jgi:hypothetical protein
MGRWLRSTMPATAIAAVAAMAAAVPSVAAQAASPPAARTAASSGTFRSAVYVKNVVSPAAALPAAVAIGDVTGDGRADLVVTTVNTDNVGGGTTIALYPQHANGTLGTPVQARTADRDDIGTRITIADLYGDGQREILLPEQSWVDVFTFKSGRLTGPSRIDAPAEDLAVANMNGDSHPDLLITTGNHKTVQIYTGSASRKFTLWRSLTFPLGAGPAYTSVFARDFNQDGRTDIAFYNGTSSAVRLQSSPGHFSPARTYRNAPIDGQVTPPLDIAAGDVTGDGYPDVIADSPSNSPFAGIEVFAGTASGPLRAPRVYTTLDSPGPMRVADLTGSGLGDLVVEHTDWENVGVMLQRPDGTLAPETLYPVNDCCDFGPDEPAVGDLNGDGKPDIAVNAGADGIAVLYGR